MKKIVVAIDGYSSCGKSTIAKALAKYAGYTYVDTGAMYRAIALYTLREALTDNAAIIAALPKIQVGFVQVDGVQHVTLNGEDVESQIRTLEVGNRASMVCFPCSATAEDGRRERYRHGRPRYRYGGVPESGTQTLPHGQSGGKGTTAF